MTKQNAKGVAENICKVPEKILPLRFGERLKIRQPGPDHMTFVSAAPETPTTILAERGERRVHFFLRIAWLSL